MIIKKINKRTKDTLKNLERKTFLRRPILFLKWLNRIDQSHAAWVSEKYRTIYFLINKCASSSIKEVLLSKSSFRRIRVKKLKNSENYFKFTFVRNPYDRIVSAYKDKIPYPAESSVMANHPKELFENMSFKDFC